MLDVDYLQSFLNEYAKLASLIRLPHLELGYVEVAEWYMIDDWSLLETCLPSALYLRDLSFSREVEQALEAAPLIGGAIKRNGSLHRLHLPNSSMMDDLTEPGHRMIQAYLTRNYMVSVLLAVPALLVLLTLAVVAARAAKRIIPTLATRTRQT